MNIINKFICVLVVLLLTSGTALATPTVTNIDAAGNIINISSQAVKGDVVSILVINLGYSVSDVYTNPSQAQQYVRSCVASDASYSFDIEMNVPSDGGGKYTAVVNAGGRTEKFVFSFYPYAQKLSIMDSIDGASNASDLTRLSDGVSVLDQAIEVFGLDTFVLTPEADKNDLASIIIAESDDGFDDADKAYETLKAAICVSALNSSSAAAFKDGYIIESEALGLDDTGVYSRYISSINSVGLEAVKTSMTGAGFECVDDAVLTFEKSVVLNLITNNKKYGNAHVESVLQTQGSILTSAGFNLSKLSEISSKSAFYDFLVSSGAKTLEDLAAKFNAYTEGTDGGNNTVGGSSAGVSSSPTVVPGYIPSEADTPMGVSFDDIASVDWAKDAITVLKDKGIINGKGNNKFDPYGNVTRAEFTKMVMGAASLVNSDSKCTFDDVTDEWAKVYIASAAELGIVTGFENNVFAPSQSISREQGAVIIYRALKLVGALDAGEPITFDDAAEFSDYSKEAIEKLSGAKIINGKGNNLFAPLDNLTRAEAAKIIYTAFSAILNG